MGVFRLGVSWLADLFSDPASRTGTCPADQPVVACLFFSLKVFHRRTAGGRACPGYHHMLFLFPLLSIAYRRALACLAAASCVAEAAAKLKELLPILVSRLRTAGAQTYVWIREA